MGKRASEWLEMHSQRHRLFLTNSGEAPRTPPPPQYSNPSLSRLATLSLSLRLSVPPQTAPSGFSPEHSSVAYILVILTHFNVSYILVNLLDKYRFQRLLLENYF